MRKVTIAVAVLASLFLIRSTALAQEDKPATEPRAARGGDRTMAMLERLGLTDEQKAKAKEILDAAKEKADKAETPQAKREIRTAAMEDIRKNVLTDEQRKKLEAMRARGARNPLAALEALGLTDEQKAKVKTIGDAARAKAEKAETPADRAEIWNAAMEDIKKNVLTDEQRKKLEAMPRRGPRGGGGPAGGGEAPAGDAGAAK